MGIKITAFTFGVAVSFFSDQFPNYMRMHILDLCVCALTNDPDLIRKFFLLLHEPAK